MNILCVREEKKTRGGFRDYSVPELLDKIDIILTEYGFVGEDTQQ
jgi:hypothetical protein